MAKETVAVALTTEQTVIKQTISLKLIELGFNALSAEAAKLVYNEDGLPEIKKFLDKVDAIRKKTNQEHTEGKAPHWAKCKDWDTAKNTIIAELEAISATPAQKNQEISAAIEKAKKDAAIAEAQLKAAKEKIDAKVLDISSRITAAKTATELTAIENEIKGIKGAATVKVNNNDDKHGLNALTIERLTAIAGLITTQKGLVKEDSDLNQQIAQAQANGDEETLNDLMDKKELLTAEITEKQQTIGSDIINLTTAASHTRVAYSTPIYADVKTKRKSWKARQAEGVDISKVSSRFTKLVLDEDAIDAFKKENKDQWDKTGKESHIEGGIEFYLEKKF